MCSPAAGGRDGVEAGREVAGGWGAARHPRNMRVTPFPRPSPAPRGRSLSRPLPAEPPPPPHPPRPTHPLLTEVPPPSLLPAELPSSPQPPPKELTHTPKGTHPLSEEVHNALQLRLGLSGVVLLKNLPARHNTQVKMWRGLSRVEQDGGRRLGASGGDAAAAAQRGGGPQGARGRGEARAAGALTCRPPGWRATAPHILQGWCAAPAPLAQGAPAGKRVAGERANREVGAGS